MASFLYYYNKKYLMKILLILINVIILNKGCNESKINQDTVSFEYTAMSRGKFLEIKVNKKITSIKKNRNEDAVIISTEDNKWKKLMETLKPIAVENIPNLKAPSENRFFDGAAIANLTVIYDGEIFKTESFDHGNPPKDIAELVKEILSISENIE